LLVAKKGAAPTPAAFASSDPSLPCFGCGHSAWHEPDSATEEKDVFVGLDGASGGAAKHGGGWTACCRVCRDALSRLTTNEPRALSCRAWAYHHTTGMCTLKFFRADDGIMSREVPRDRPRIDAG